MSRTPIFVGVCACCILGVAIGLFAPLDPLNRLWYQRDDRPLVLPTSELPRKQAVIDLLRRQRYDDLERIYALTLAADQASGTDTLDRFNAFAFADPALQEFLDSWNAERDGSALPLLARGQYYLHLAYTVRGKKFTSETSRDQFRQMRRYMDLAGRDFQRAIEVGPPSVAAYQGLIDIAITTSDRSLAMTALRQALAATDNPLPLHLTYMRGLEVKWGGSQGATLDYWDSLRRSGTLRRSTQDLDFIGTLLMAEEACSREDCETALDYYEEALTLQPARRGHLGHARVLAALERYDEALDVIESGLQRDPDVADLHELKATIHWATDRQEEALAEIRDALKLDPYNPDFLMISQELLDELDKARHKSGEVAKAKRYRQERYRNMEKAFVYGASRGDVQLAWARAALGNGEPRERAYAAFEEAIRLAPKDPDYVLAYAGALSNAKDCKAMQFYRRFERMCKGGVDCSKYAELEHLAGSMMERCENPQAARRKRMRPGTLEQMETCNSYFSGNTPERALSQCIDKAESGDTAAAFDLGIIYATGYGVGIDHRNAVHWLEVAVESDHPRAKGVLGNFVYRGMGTTKDSGRGLRLLREAAEAGDTTAMYALGFIYYEGHDGDRDLHASRRWFAQAAERGNNEARRAMKRLFDGQASNH